MQTDTERRRRVIFCAPAVKRYATAEFTPRCPGSFRPVSVTGRSCALHCPHCEGRLLAAMAARAPGESLFDVCARLRRGGARGILVSGGCDDAGRVPLAGLGPILQRIRRELGLTVAVHTGLVEPPVARELAEARVECAMLDLVGSRATAREVYGIDAGPPDYESSLASLVEAGVPTVPHVVLGLRFGRMDGEGEALAMAARHAIAGFVVVVLTPLQGTAMAAVAPPSLREVAAFLQRARETLPDVPVLLGCARPAGPARAALDRAALDAGLDGIAFPAEGTVARARRLGREVEFSESCCALACTRGAEPW